MLTYTVTSRDLAEGDIYAIEPVASLREFLKPHRSLCIVKTPCDGTVPEMTRVMGKDRRGDPVGGNGQRASRPEREEVLRRLHAM